MSRVWYVFFIVLIAFLAIFVIFLMFNDHTQNHLIANSLQQAVMEDLQDSRDDSSRMVKGVYAVNETEFRDNFAHNVQIKDLNYPSKKYYFLIRFLNDNDNESASSFRQFNHNNPNDSNVTTDNHNDSEPIRGVQVIAIPEGTGNDKINSYLNRIGYYQRNSTGIMKYIQGHEDSYDSNAKGTYISKDSSNAITVNSLINYLKTKGDSKYVSSVVIQENDKDSNNPSTDDNNLHNTDDIYKSSKTHNPNSNNSSNMTDLTDNN